MLAIGFPNKKITTPRDIYKAHYNPIDYWWLLISNYKLSDIDNIEIRIGRVNLQDISFTFFEEPKFSELDEY